MWLGIIALSRNSASAVRFAIVNWINPSNAKLPLEVSPDPEEDRLCGFMDTICGVHLGRGGSYSLDGAYSVYRLVESDRNLEFMAICWALGPGPGIGEDLLVPVHLKAGLRGAQLSYDLHIDSLKEFSSADRMWKHFYPFAHGDSDDWEWRHNFKGAIHLPNDASRSTEIRWQLE